MALVAIATCLLIVGCTGSTTNHPVPPTTGQQRGIATPPALTFSSPAAKYNEPSQPHPSSELGDTILAKVHELAVRAGRSSPTTDENLFIAATALASVVPEDGLLTFPLVQFAFQSNGVIEPSPHLLVMWGELGDPRGVANTFQPRLEQILRQENISRVGVGAVVRGGGDYGVVVLGLLMSRARMSPIPRAMAVDDVVKLEFTVERGLKLPKVWFANPNGLVEKAHVHSSGDTFFASIACGGMTGKMQVEIVESGEVLARFPLWCGVDPPRTFKIVPRENDVPNEPADAERKIFEAVNRERTKLGRPALVWDAGVAKIAREHSLDMQRRNVVDSRLDGVTVSQRVRAIHVDLITTANVARVYGVTEAFEGLLNSPSTRAPLISPEATQIGIGIVYGKELAGRRELYITQIVAVRSSEDSD